MTTTLPPAANPFDDPASDPLALAAEAAAVIAERSGAATHDIALVPVSYTHLDVYKRQIDKRASRWMQR